NRSSPSDLKYIDGIWIQACMLMGQGVTMFLGGIMEQTLGVRLATLIGSWFLSAGVLLTHFTIQTSYITSVLTYGVMFGLGCGASYAIPVGAAMRWFPKYRGFVGGAVFFGFGVGSMIFNQIITVFVNPNNLAPNVQGEDGERYFGQEDILDRVPTLFLLLGGTYAVVQFTAFFLISDPPTDMVLSGNRGKYSTEVAGLETDGGTVWTVQSTATTNMESNGSATEVENTTDHSSVTSDVTLDTRPLEMLKTPMFYIIWVLFLFGGLGGVFLASQWKAYGQTFMQDDRFFSIVGSCASALNAVSGMVWGWIADRYTCKLTIQLLYAMFASVAYTLLAAEEAGKAFFLIWVCLVYSCLSGIYGVMPSTVGRVFGNKYIGINYGLILTSAASAFVGQMLLDRLGYHGLFFLIGGTLTL
ncbi:hypothetical protein BaRGS_00036964, partial [Batillaria attramentaria]